MIRCPSANCFSVGVNCYQARAFGVGVELHEPTFAALKKFGEEKFPNITFDDSVKRMAILPVGCKLLPSSGWTPIAIVENVYILPGIPSMVKDMLTCNEEHFVGVPIHRVIVCSMPLHLFFAC